MKTRLAVLGLLVLAFGLAAYAAPVTFGYCPSAGSDTSGCELQINILAVNGSGVVTSYTVTTSSPDMGPYDGIEDTYIGVVNMSGSVAKSINLTGIVSGVGIFAFDGDGVGTYVTGNSNDSTGYGGPGVLFSGITTVSVTDDKGTVNFGCTTASTSSCAGLAAGGSGYFSLEEAISGSVLAGSPEPGTLLLCAGGLIGLGILRFRKRA